MKRLVAGLIETTARSATSKDQTDAVLRTWEDLAFKVGENAKSEYVQVLRHAIRMLDEAPGFYERLNIINYFQTGC
jgi:hypothetical protein